MRGFERDAWERRNRAENHFQTLEQRANAALLRLRQAAVPLERLTGHDAWDQFLRLGEQRQEDDRKERDAIAARLAGPDYLTAEEAARLRWRAAQLTLGIQVRQELLDLPKVILQILSEVNG